MKRSVYILLVIFFALSACTKVEKIRTSGIDTIDNTIHQTTTYFVYGFSFSQAKLVSNLGKPPADISLWVNADVDTIPPRLFLQADNLKPSFYKVGDYADAASAITAFDNLKTVTATLWTDSADPILNNQVWIYRSGNDTYAKIRIISTINEKRQLVDYGECTFQWVYQADGSSTFSGK